jgi:bacterioferritin-associated ferredoxin
MYVCCCKAVTDHQIVDLVNSGTTKTWRELVKQTCVATQCGICARTAKACFDKAAQNVAAQTDQTDQTDTDSQ